jgi:cation diffusion facilitator family transporter
VRVGRRIGNQSLIANAWHHRSDALSSVAVLCGLVPAIYVTSLAILDPIAAALVSLFIIKVGFDIVVPAFRQASDASPSAETITEIQRTAASVDGVRDAHDIRARFYSSRIYAEVHIVVDPLMTVADAHEIGVAVRKKIRAEVKNMLDVIVHIDPDDGTSNIPTRPV